MQATILTEINGLEKQSEKLNQQFNSLLSLHAERAITSEQFKEKNRLLSEQQFVLANRKMELQSQLDEKKTRIRIFRPSKKSLKAS